jgi:hypothetical protein
MTLGDAAAVHVRLIVWCKACRHQVEPDAGEQAESYGADACPGVAGGSSVRNAAAEKSIWSLREQRRGRLRTRRQVVKAVA